MEFKEKDRQLTILIEDLYEWHEMFDGTSSTNIIEVPIGKNNIDFFFPNRKKYINDDDLEQKLIADANHFKAYKQGTLHMVKSLRLVDVSPLDRAAMMNIFKKR